jgi:thioredoxin 1
MKLLKFYAEWCQPCKMQSQIIKRAGDKIKTPIEDVDIDNNIMMSVEYQVRSVPTMVLLDDDGKEVKRQVGMLNEKQLLEFLGE